MSQQDPSPRSDTPMLQQWHACKQKAGDALLLFRLGDFYEAFESDAPIIARDLEIALTARHGVPMAGIPWMALVRDIQIHPNTHDLIVGTHGRGIFIIDDISPLRNLTGELSGRDVHFFPAPPQTLTTGRFGGGSVVNGGFAAGNPPALPAFQYYLH